MPISTTIKRIELKKGLQFLRNGLTRSERKKDSIQLEIEIYKNNGTMRIRGAEYNFTATSDTYGKVTLPLLMLWEVIKSQKEDVIQLILSDRKLLTNTGVNITNARIEMLHTEDLVTPELPLNYNHRDLIQLSFVYNDEQLRQMGMDHEVARSEEELERAIERVYRSLRSFNISKREIRTFVINQLKKN